VNLDVRRLSSVAFERHSRTVKESHCRQCLGRAARIAAAARGCLGETDRISTPTTATHASAELHRLIGPHLFGLLEAHLTADPTWPNHEIFLDYPENITASNELWGIGVRATVSWWPEGRDLPNGTRWWPSDRQPSYQHGVPYMDEPVQLELYLNNTSGELSHYILRFGSGITVRVVSVAAPN
jgi:hypothetical protein